MSDSKKELSEFTKQEIEKLKAYEGEELKFPLTKHHFDFWSLHAQDVFPHTPELQEAFNKEKKKRMLKQKIRSFFKNNF